MADHMTPLRLTDVQFDALLDKLEFSFANGFAAFFYRQPTGPTLIDVFDPRDAGFSVEEWELYAPSLPYLDGLLVFAFEAGPSSVIQDWADEHEPGYGEIAITRVAQMREKLPAVRREWTSRMSLTGGKVLGDTRAQILLNPETAEWQALLRIDAFVPGGPPRRSPVESSREWLTALVTRNDLSRMISVLERTRAMMPEFDPGNDLEIEEGA